MSDALSRGAPAAMPGTTLVLDIGKSNAKLALIDARGELLRSASVANTSEHDDEHGYLALGVKRLEAWLLDAVPSLLGGLAPDRIVATTHGAAFCALGADELVLPPVPDYVDGSFRTDSAGVAPVDAPAAQHAA